METVAVPQWGKLIHQQRKQLGLTQRQVADLIGVTSQTIWNWEAGVRLPHDRYQIALVQTLGISPDDLARLFRGAA